MKYLSWIGIKFASFLLRSLSYFRCQSRAFAWPLCRGDH